MIADNSRFGAFPEDWEHFANTLGLQEDLLPVVSNPNATISPQSKMQHLGKTPSRYNSDSEAVGIPKWPTHMTDERDIQRWTANTDYGICLQTRLVRAIDIDIGDADAAEAVRAVVRQHFSLPTRTRGNSGKCLHVIKLPGDYSKRIIRTEHGIIEFLATGQQFIACGTHPSGARYEWDGGLPTEIPEVSPMQFEALWADLVAQFAVSGKDSREVRGMIPVTPRQVADTTDPTVAWLDENGWVRAHQRDGRVDVRCPWEDGHSSDSGPTATSYFPAGVGGFDSGHFRCLHASCSGRTDQDFLTETGFIAGQFDVVAPQVGEDGEIVQPLPPFERDKQGRPLGTLTNVLMALRREDVCGFSIRHDTFLGMVMVRIESSKWRPLRDTDYTTMRETLAVKGFRPVTKDMMRDCVDKIGEEQEFDTAIDWASTLPAWDGVQRIDSFFPTFFSVDDRPYTRAVGRYLWTALAARCLSPGCQVDMVPVLVGAQGVGKTQAVKAICPFAEGFAEINLEHKDDNLARSIRGKLVGEIAELRGLAGRQSEFIKAWITRTVEEWTPKFREHGYAFPRRLVCIGTSNRDDFLDDDTGERRWLPMTVGLIDVESIKATRSQLWAEGIAVWRRDGVAWAEAKRLAVAEHSEFKHVDPWTESIERWLHTEEFESTPEAPVCRGMKPFSSHDVMTSALKLEVAHVNKAMEMRVGKTLKGLGYEARSIWIAEIGKTAKRWIKKWTELPDLRRRGGGEEFSDPLLPCEAPKLVQ